MKLEYKTKVSFMTNSELINEYESVFDMCKYVSADNFEHQKVIVCEYELRSRNLDCLIKEFPTYRRSTYQFK